MSETVLSVKDLKTYFYLSSGVCRAVDGVSFELKRGEILGIIGESGSGKSVMSKSIIKLLPKNIGRIVEGEITFNGTDIVAMNEKELRDLRGSSIAMIFQDPMTSLDPVFKVGDQMIEMIQAHGNISREEARNIAINALRSVNIPEPEARMDSYPFELSGGMCQRVIIAMALCENPEIIIADEPTTALDVTIQAQVLKLIRELRDKNDTSVLLITHNLGIVWQMCDKVMVMYAGKVVEQTSVKDLYAEPLHPYTWGLLDSMPSLAVEPKQELNTIKGVPPDLRLTGTCCNFYNRCPYAKPICAEQVPPMLEVKEGHFVACHRQTDREKLMRGGSCK